MSLTSKELKIQERSEKARLGAHPWKSKSWEIESIVYLCSTVYALREEIERLEKALDQATIRMDIRAGGAGRVNDITGKWEPVQIDINVSPELAAYLRKRSEAKQAEQTATQPASTNQKDGEL